MPDAVLAHGIGGVQDLPLPLSYAVTGAAVVLVVTFLLLATLLRDAACCGATQPGGRCPG